MELEAAVQMAGRLLRGLPKAVGNGLKSFARWYWRLSLVSQLCATAVLVPLTNVGLAELGVLPAARGQITLLVGVALIGGAIAATLAHGSGGIREG